MAWGSLGRVFFMHIQCGAVGNCPAVAAGTRETTEPLTIGVEGNLGIQGTSGDENHDAKVGAKGDGDHGRRVDDSSPAGRRRPHDKSRWRKYALPALFAKDLRDDRQARESPSLGAFDRHAQVAHHVVLGGILGRYVGFE